MDNEKSNKIVLLMALALVLLIFMDFQARRHFEKQVGFDINSVEYAKDRVFEARQSLEQPIRTTAQSLLGKTREVISGHASQLKKESKDYATQKIKKASSNFIQEIQAQKIDNPGSKHLEDKIEPTPQSFSLYFIRFRRGRSELVSVKRQVNNESLTFLEVLENLQEGPRLRENGLINAFTNKIQLHSLKKEDGIIVLDVSSEIGQMGSHVIRDRLDQIVFTLTQFSDIDSVVILVDGNRINSLGNNQISIPSQIYRRNRKVFLYQKL